MHPGAHITSPVITLMCEFILGDMVPPFVDVVICGMYVQVNLFHYFIV